MGLAGSQKTLANFLKKLLPSLRSVRRLHDFHTKFSLFTLPANYEKKYFSGGTRGAKPEISYFGFAPPVRSPFMVILGSSEG